MAYQYLSAFEELISRFEDFGNIDLADGGVLRNGDRVRICASKSDMRAARSAR
jgi:hypothetical protein